MARDREVRRDRAGFGPDPSESRRRLVSIDALKNFEIAKGEPDVRGWEVRTLSDRDVGSVEDLLIDPERGEVVMLQIGLHDDRLRSEVALRSVQLDRGRNVVLVDSADVDAGARNPGGEVREDYREPDVEPGRTVAADGAEGARRGEVRTDDPIREEDAGAVTEEVVERRPYVEEVVIRRRPAE
jgi:hypothetical protein